MKVLIKNAHIITMNDQDFENGQLFIDNSHIGFVGQTYEGALKPDKIIDAKSKIIMPGFINAHSHTAMSVLKNISDDTNLEDWLFNSILPLEKNFDEETIYNASMLGIAEYVRNGITTFADMYFLPIGTIKAVKKSGIRASICLGYNPEDLRNINQIESEYLQNKNISNLISYMLHVHSIYACDEAQISNIINLAHKYKLGVYTHMSETLDEVSNCTVKHNGLTPTKLLEELGFFDLPATVAHAVHVDKEDIDVLKNYNVNVVTNPASNLKLGSGIAPLYALKKAGLNVAIGTDGAASNNSLNMFREMYLASTLQKALLNDASILNAEDTLKMATINGAKALGLEKVGKLKKGYKADIIMLDFNAPNVTPHNNIKNAIVYSAGVQNVVMTMVNGKILYENGKYFIGENINDILSKANQTIDKLKKY